MSTSWLTGPLRWASERSPWLAGQLGRGFLRSGGTQSRPAVVLDINKAPLISAWKQFAFISGCPGATYRYRCEHHAEVLRNIGYAVDVFSPNYFPFGQIIRNYGIIVAHRVQWNKQFDRFVRHARSIGALVVYDIDDLIFDIRRIDQIDPYHRMYASKKSEYLDHMELHNRAMALCNAITVSTDKLLDEAQVLHPTKPAAIMRNKISQAMCRFAEESVARTREVSNCVTIAYFSGTATHDKDFAVCAGVLRRILLERENVRLTIVGHLEFPEELIGLESRIDRIPFVPWQHLSELYRNVDINLAPLEYESDFTASKSELKFLESALLGVPTVASDVGAYRTSIANWQSGVLCARGEEWYRAITRLVLDHDLRRKLGAAARSIAMCNTTSSYGQVLQRQWCDLVASALDRAPGTISMPCDSKASGLLDTKIKSQEPVSITRRTIRRIAQTPRQIERKLRPFFHPKKK